MKKTLLGLGLVGLLGCTDGNSNAFGNNSEYVLSNVFEGVDNYKIHSNNTVDAYFRYDMGLWLKNVGIIDRETKIINFHDPVVEENIWFFEENPWIQLYGLHEDVPGNYADHELKKDCAIDLLELNGGGFFGTIGNNNEFEPYIMYDFNSSVEDIKQLSEITLDLYSEQCD